MKRPISTSFLSFGQPFYYSEIFDSIPRYLPSANILPMQAHQPCWFNAFPATLCIPNALMLDAQTYAQTHQISETDVIINPEAAVQALARTLYLEDLERQLHHMPHPPNPDAQFSSPFVRVKTEPDFGVDSDIEHRRPRGRPPGAKDKKPRKKRGAVGADAVPSSAGEEEHNAHRSSEAPSHVDNATQRAGSEPQHQGRCKPWKIVLSAEEARDIYKHRTSGQPAAVCSELSKRYSVHAKTIRDIWNRETWVKTTSMMWTDAERTHYESKRQGGRFHSSPHDIGSDILARGADKIDFHRGENAVDMSRSELSQGGDSMLEHWVDVRGRSPERRSNSASSASHRQLNIAGLWTRDIERPTISRRNEGPEAVSGVASSPRALEENASARPSLMPGASQTIRRMAVPPTDGSRYHYSDKLLAENRDESFIAREDGPGISGPERSEYRFGTTQHRDAAAQMGGPQSGFAHVARGWKTSKTRSDAEPAICDQSTAFAPSQNLADHASVKHLLNSANKR